MIEFAAITSAISKYAPQASQLIIKQAQKNESVIKILQELKLNSTQILDDVDTVYGYTLVKYGVFKPEAILNLFREKIIKDYFWDAYSNNAPFQFVENTKKLLNQNSELKSQIITAKINFLGELEEFGEVFISVAKLTKSEKYQPYPDWDLDVYPKEFKALIFEKTRLFCGRDFVFKAIHNFFITKPKGYFSVIGDAGMGKSAIAAKYVLATKFPCYFNVFAEGRNKPEKFLSSIRQQLIKRYSLQNVDNADLRTLLQKVSEELKGQKLVIVVDALDEVEQEGNGNLLDLPQNLPDGIYFLLTRRLYNQETKRLTLSPDTPVDELDLTRSDYTALSQEDIKEYLHLSLNNDHKLRIWINNRNISEDNFTQEIAIKSENNFIYLRYLLPGISEGKYNDLTLLTSKSSEFQNLFLGQFPEQQLKAGNSAKYYQTLTDFDFIYLKIQYPQFGIEALIRDFYLIDNPEILNGLKEEDKLEPEKVKTLKLIQRTLELSAHVLNQDTNQLVGQLWGRLQSFKESKIYNLLADARQSRSEIPRFRPITASLTNPGGNLLRTLTGHNSSVMAVAITPDGKTAISASFDNTLKLWDLQTGREISTLIGHSDSVRSVAIAPDGKTAVAGFGDNTLKLWDLETGIEIFTLTGNNDSVITVAIAPEGKTAVASFGDNTLKLWDLETGKEISTFTCDSPINCCAISPDGFTIVAGDTSGRVHFLRLESGKKMNNITQNTINIPRYPPEFEQIITTKNHHFVGRQFVFAAINNFLNQSDRGYFIIVGDPGIGKSAILAHYVSQNPGFVYYNVEISGKNRVEEFLTTICTQLIEIA